MGLGAGFRRSASSRDPLLRGGGEGKEGEGVKDTREREKERERRGEILARCHARYKGCPALSSMELLCAFRRGSKGRVPP